MRLAIIFSVVENNEQTYQEQNDNNTCNELHLFQYLRVERKFFTRIVSEKNNTYRLTLQQSR